MADRSRPAARLHVVVIAPDAPGRKAPGLATWLAAVAPRAATGEVTVALVSDRRIRTLNRTFRGLDAVTDVLSFPSQGAAKTSGGAPQMGRDGPTLGDIAIATGVARRQAVAAGHALATELRVLALHGLLHLIGFDHDTDGGRMARTEARLRRRGGLKEGLIERSAPSAARSAGASRGSRRR